MLTAVEPAAEPAVERGRRQRRGPFGSWTFRRLGGSLAAAVLAGLLVGSATFAASRAGGPLYDARLAFEEMTLPTDPEARLEAELAQAQSRLAEIVEAAGRRDSGAVDAAAAAYAQSLDALSSASGGPADRALEAIEFHRTILLQLVGTAPVQALGGLENALERSSGVIAKLGAAGTGAEPGAGGAGGNGGSSSGAGGGSNAGGGNGGSNAGGGDAKTPPPHRTPAPGKTPEPANTTAPDKSPAPDKGAGSESSPTPAPSEKPGRP